MSVFRQLQRAWCADLCGRRILLTAWHQAHGHVFSDCYVQAMERTARDDERRQLSRYTDEERARL